MTIMLDPELQVLMAKDKSVAVLWQDATHGRTAFLAKAADQDVDSFKGNVPIQLHWELGRFACGSVLRMHIIIFDRPDNPYRFETFINVASPEQLACAKKLISQEALQLHFFDSRTEYVLTKEIKYPLIQRRQLEKLTAQALQDLTKLGPAWDFDLAKVVFQAHHPL